MEGDYHPCQKISINKGCGAALPSLDPVSGHRHDKHDQRFRHHRQKNGMKDCRQEIRLLKQILKVLNVKTFRETDGAFQDITITFKRRHQRKQYRINKQ